MKNKLFYFVLFYFVSTILLFSQSPFNTLWERCVRTGNKPNWFGTGTERGLALGDMGNGERLYVVSRNGGKSIKVIDPTNGNDITLATPFDLSSCSGGLLEVSSCDMTEDNVLIVGNVTNNAASDPFKLYIWTSEGGAPTSTASFTLNNKRVGDNIKVVGNWFAGTVKIYTAWANVATNAKIYVLSTTNQGATWTTDSITLTGAYTGTVTYPNLAVLPDGSFYIAGNGAKVRKHNSSGAYVANTLFNDPPVKTSSYTALEYFVHNGREYIVANQYRRIDEITTNNKRTRAVVYDVTTPGSVSVFKNTLDQTPLLQDVGDVTNSPYGDIEIKYNPNGKIKIFVLGTDQGIGAYETNSDPLPVVLSSIKAFQSGEDVIISWVTETEINNWKFEIEKANLKSDNPEEYVKIGEVKGAGNSNVKNQYQFVDKKVSSGTYAYRIKQIDFDGKAEYFIANNVTVKFAVTDYQLYQNYPNPFNPTTTIKFALPEKSNVVLKIYDVLGKEISVITNNTYEAGEYEFTFDASKLNSGIYICKLQAGNVVLTRKMILTK
jgi:hypothetical protein